MAATAIEWATHVWNPFTGCDRVSPGCAHCYAATVAAGNQRKELGRYEKAYRHGTTLPKLRYQNDGHPKTSGPGFAFTVHQDKLDNPTRFPAGARVFVNSMSDVFHEEAPLEAIALLFDQCRLQPWANFLILTKRAERMAAIVPEIYDPLVTDLLEHDEEFLPNVWLGVSIENRRFVHRADLLRETPAAVRFISAEPLLGPLVGPERRERDYPIREGRPRGVRETLILPGLNLTDIDWLIVGGESGPGHRPMRAEWVRDLRDACTAQRPERIPTASAVHAQPLLAHSRRVGLEQLNASTAFFFKQHGGVRPKSGGRELDGRTWDEFPRALIGAAG